MSTVYTQSDFFEPGNQLNSLHFNVGYGTVITEALPQHRSVAHGPGSNGTLAAMGRIRGAKNTHRSIDEIGQLFDWVVHDQPRFIHLIGHGSAGIIHVGCDRTSQSIEGILHAYNHFYWQERMERISRYDSNKQEKLPAHDVRYSGGLLLEGSCIAEGEEGAKFMKLLADTTLRTVFAFTGLIIVKDHREVLFEKGHQWLRQEPLARDRYLKANYTPPEPIAYHALDTARNIAGMEQENLKKFKFFDIHTQGIFTIDGDTAHLLYSELSSQIAFQQDGHVLGSITHQFDFYFENNIVKAELFSNRLLKTSLGISYFVGKSFMSLLTGELR